MPNYRRWYSPGGTYFFTLVTYQRARFLCDDLARQLLRRAIDQCRADRPFVIEAFALMPDHLHAIWRLPPDDADFSSRWGIIKKTFTQSWLDAGGGQGITSASREANRRRGVWQRRFWEHRIRDRDDYQGCFDYVHFNPVRHGLSKCPHDWPWSSFHRWVRDGVYERDWCCSCDGRHVEPPRLDWLDSSFD